MIKEKVGNRIRELRKEKGFSQEKLALICGIDRTYIAGVECGKRNISIVNLEKIANGLEIDLKDFFVVFQNLTPHKHRTFGVFS